MANEVSDVFLNDIFDRNYNILKEETGHALSPDLKSFARMQVLYYWRKLKEIANNVTETEVKLSLPNRISPRNKKFTIEGIVDIVRGVDKTVMYDIKTHEPEQIQNNIDDFEKQLNVYSYIWQNLRGESLDETAIIATSFPKALRKAVQLGDEVAIDQEFQKWDPVIKIKFMQERVEKTIEEFGEIVDCIENHEFGPLAIEKLNATTGGSTIKLATWLCRNCDARYSCESYRRYSLGSKSKIESQFRKYINDVADEDDLDARRDAGIEISMNVYDNFSL